MLITACVISVIVGGDGGDIMGEFSFFGGASAEAIVLSAIMLESASAIGCASSLCYGAIVTYVSIETP